ncbi:FCD domain-containing protein [Mycobacterium cookii]|uniref:GntR family transcriptional regulator n=1 Tax=Mycobacterium cookii TaxID=1775 RepID=A0A7I7L460_9MYCO|nr:FCD domain-containing protein [Mycobacterium cookii]MCV7329340.1 FadR family transcriptional regulator [Mycobacterium cookii]BBX48827.1 GntR family transcriptional regulator [Mycobacterium cookii]
MSLAAANPRPDKRASQIARRIEADVIRRGWPVGQSLGSEQALQQRYRVSRSVLREAVRLVEHHQVARMRRGPNGGLLVCEPDAAPATHAIIIYLEYVGTTIGDLLDARLLLEPLAASLAAQRIDEVGIDRLRAVLRAEEGHPPDPARPHDDFHAALAEQSKNPVLQLFIDILMRLTVRYAEDSRLTSARDALEAIDLRHRDHSAVVDAVTAGDAARAMTLSERHAESVTAWLQDHHQPRARHVPDRDAPPGKLAEVLAAAIRDDIASSGWQVGEVFGTEVALLERYRVSRSVLREAVRLLEYHAVATTRRGPGGGLVVAEPQAQASIDTIALYLQYREPRREDLSMIRDAIEIDNVAKVVRRHDTAEVRAFLDRHRALIEEAGDDPRKAGVEEFLFHTGLATLAGNAVLELFLRILVELFRRHWASTDRPVPSHGDLVDVRHAHLRIIEAIAHGDDSLARHRVRRHLDAAASWWL